MIENWFSFLNSIDDSGRTKMVKVERTCLYDGAKILKHDKAYYCIAKRMHKRFKGNSIMLLIL